MDLMGVFDYVGVAAFAVTGVLKGIKHRLDIFGLFVLAAFTALGGGIIRDLLLNIAPPMALLNPYYWWLILATVVITILLNGRKFLKADSLILNTADAIGLAAFTVIGCKIAHINGAGGIAVVFSGVLTAIGGGVIRDMLVREIPFVLRVSVYATAALLGAACFYAGLVLFGDVSFAFRGTAVFSIVFIIRMVAILKKWRLPRGA
jgi:uncharacterized membrane protein YeiH